MTKPLREDADSPSSAPSGMEDDSQEVGPQEDIPLNFEAVYELEFPVRCPSCQQRVSTVGVVRLIRSRVNFISTFPRRGYLAVCPNCSTIVPTTLSGLL